MDTIKEKNKMNNNIKNDDVYLVAGDFNQLPKVYSSFQKAEEVILTEIRTLGVCEFWRTIICVQINTNIVHKTNYFGSIEIKDEFKCIIIKRDEHNTNGCKKIHREKIRLSLDY